MKTFVIIPALNEAPSIGAVLHDIPRDLVAGIIVVDNGSSDETPAIARAAGATVLFENRRGYGWACRCGIDYAAGLDADVLAFLDGDYSDFPAELQNVLRPIQQDEADFVVGSRTIGNRERGALLPQARFGNWLACSLMRIFWGARFTDLGPFRAIRRTALVDLHMTEMTYGWTVEMQIKAVKSGLRCAEVPVSYRRRIGKSKVTGTVSGTIGASANILRTLARHALVRTHRGPQS